MRLAPIALLLVACGPRARPPGPGRGAAGDPGGARWRWAAIDTAETPFRAIDSGHFPRAFLYADGGFIADVDALRAEDLEVEGSYLRVVPPGEEKPLELYLGHAGWIVEESVVDGSLVSEPVRLRGRTAFDWPMMRFPHVAGAKVELMQVDEDGVRRLAPLPVPPGLLAAPPASRPPAHVYHVGGARPSDETWNVLLVGDGFAEAELNRFRGATARLVDAVLRDDWFGPFGERLSFLRMDAIDPEGVDDSACGGGCTQDRMWEERAMIRAEEPVVEGPGPSFRADFGAVRCRGPSSHGRRRCSKLRISSGGMERIEHLHRSLRGALRIRAVGVLANVRVDSGSASVVLNPKLIGGTFTFGVETAASGGGLFAHELGHALGLLDEHYPGHVPRRPMKLPPFLPRRNVWHCELPYRAEASCTTTKLPWELPAGCYPRRLSACPPATSDCTFVPSAAPDTGPCLASPLWQGAFYSRTDYFRRSERCLMLDKSSPLCDACRRHLESVLATAR